TLRSPIADESRYQHPAEYNVLAARIGWMPAYPQSNNNSLSFAEEAREAGKTTNEEISERAIDALKSGETDLAIADPDRPVKFLRALFVWRTNLVSSSAKGQEYFMKHLFGATSNLLAEPNDEMKPEEVRWREDVEGKLDLLVALDFRMTTTPIY